MCTVIATVCVNFDLLTTRGLIVVMCLFVISVREECSASFLPHVSPYFKFYYGQLEMWTQDTDSIKLLHNVNFILSKNGSKQA